MKHITQAFLKVLFIVLCINVTVVAIADSIPSGEYPPDIKRILDRNKLIVATVNLERPPFFMSNENGELSGFDVELARNISKELGIEVEFNRTANTFDEVIDLVARKEADIAVSKLSITLNRAKKVLFSDPYIILQKSLLLNRFRLAKAKGEQSTAAFIKDFKGDIGVIEKTSYVDFAKRMFPQATINTRQTWEEIVEEVTDGRLLSALRDDLEIKRIIKEQPDVALQLQTVVFSDAEDPIAIAVSWDSINLLRWINLYLKTINVNIDADKLLDMYFKNEPVNLDKSAP